MSVTDDIKERLDIVEIISASLPLRKSGRSYVGFCPFHANTRTPAFTVYPDTQSYHCFGCKASGDVFTFLMQRQGLEFRDALEQLAARAGVQLQERTPEDVQQDQQRTRLLEINAAAAKYFNYVLLALPRGEPGREYLAERGINDQTIEAFQLGYSIDDWSRLLSYLTDKKGFEPEEIEAAGLAIRREDGGYYDRFRGRLIFPIRNTKGETIAFGGRALGDAQPKYLNSPQTPLFDKSSVLYGLDLAREGIRNTDAVVIVEGYIDVLTAHQYGFRNIIAPLGTALTSQHVQTIKKLSRNIYLALDADAAGQKATLRGLTTLDNNLERRGQLGIPTPTGFFHLERDISGELRVLPLPIGRDPDEIIKEDPQQWQKLFDKALSLTDFYISALTSDLNLQSAQGKTEAIRRVGPLVALKKDAIERAHYIQQLANLIDIEAKTVENAIIQHRLNDKEKKQNPETIVKKHISVKATLHEKVPLTETDSILLGREDMLLVLMLRYAASVPTVEQVLGRHIDSFPLIKGLLPTEPATLLERTENRLIWRAWRSQAAPSADPIAWAQDLPLELREHAARLLMMELPQNQEYRYKLDAEQCALYLRTQQTKKLTLNLVKYIDKLDPEAEEERDQCMKQIDDLQAYLGAFSTPTRSPSYKDLRNKQDT